MKQNILEKYWRSTLPGKVEEVNMSRIEERLSDITDVFHEIHLKKKCTNYWICHTIEKKNGKKLHLHEV